MSTLPPFQGGLLPMARTEAYQRVRESEDPDDYRGRFAVWSGDSAARPVRAAHGCRVPGPDCCGSGGCRRTMMGG
jgi:hypothetical protein